MARVTLFDKRAFLFVPYGECTSISFSGMWLHQEQQAIAMEKSCCLSIRARNVTSLYGLFTRHDWSGKIKVKVNGAEVDCFDLYSPWRFQQCLPVFLSDRRSDANVEITIVGASRFSRACQMVFAGILLLREEAAGAVERISAGAAGALANSKPESFRDLQIQMVDRYGTSLASRGVDLQEEARRRWARYTMRFREALVYAPPGAHMLDIGAGFLTDEFVRHIIIPNNLDYWAQDIDPRVVQHDRAVFSSCGIDPEHVREGDNTELPYGDGFFDLVYSSHCLEHSSDILRTFAEIRRILKPGGVLFFAVPFGYDHADEHVYALDIDGWRALTVAHGFDVLSEHVGKFYTEPVHDLVIVARKL